MYSNAPTKSISDIVHHAHSAIGIPETVRTDLHAWTALLLAEGAASGVVFVVAKGVVAIALRDKTPFIELGNDGEQGHLHLLIGRRQKHQC